MVHGKMQRAKAEAALVVELFGDIIAYGHGVWLEI